VGGGSLRRWRLVRILVRQRARVGCVGSCEFSWILGRWVRRQEELWGKDLGRRLIGESSIREFCELDMPIFMFDKDEAFVVMRLEQVCSKKERLVKKEG